MNLNKLNDIWNTFSENTILSEFEYKLISTETIPLLNIGKTENGNRCLVLEIPKSSNIFFPESIKEHIELRFFKRENCLCIILKDNLYCDLFDDLTLSIFYKIQKKRPTYKNIAQTVYNIQLDHLFFEFYKILKVSNHQINLLIILLLSIHY